MLPVSFAIDIVTLIYKRLKGIKRNYDQTIHVISVIIPAYNASHSIRDTVNSLCGQTIILKNIIVVDDCSPDNTIEVCNILKDELGSRFYYIRREKNVGKAANINYIVQEFDDILGDIIIVTDSDIKLEEDCIERLIRNFISEKVAVVTPYGYTIPPKNYFARMLHYGNSWNNEVFKMRKNAQDYRGAISVICGANTAYRKEVLKKLPIPLRTKTEDTDYTWVLQENGYNVVYEETAIIHSEDLENLGGLIHQWFRWYSGTFQSLYVHGKDVLKAKRMFWTTIFPSLIESLLYSVGLVFLPLIAVINIADPGIIPLGMNYVYGFLIGDFLLTTVPTVFIAPKYLQRGLVDIYVYKFIGSALTIDAFLITFYEKITKKESKWSNTWTRNYGFQNLIICDTCGNKIEDDAIYCSNCGIKVKIEIGVRHV